MSFSLPTVDHVGEKACFLEPDALTPELLCRLGLCDMPNMPVYALWGGSELCIDLLLTAIADEAANRSLDSFACRSPSAPHRRYALWVEGVGLLKPIGTTLPQGAKLIDLSSLSRNAEIAEKIDQLKEKHTSLYGECRNLSSAAARVAHAQVALTAPLHHSQTLSSKAARIAAAQPIGNRQTRSIPITAVTANGGRLRLFPFGEAVQIIGLRELYGAAARFLSLLSNKLDERDADRVELTDLWSGTAVGIWLPSQAVCYLTDPPERRKKLMTLSHYLSPRTQDVRTRYRALENCIGEIDRHLVYLAGEIDMISRQIDEIEENALQKSRLGEFRKRLLIDLFCKQKR